MNLDRHSASMARSTRPGAPRYTDGSIPSVPTGGANTPRSWRTAVDAPVVIHGVNARGVRACASRLALLLRPADRRHYRPAPKSGRPNSPMRRPRMPLSPAPGPALAAPGSRRRLRVPARELMLVAVFHVGAHPRASHPARRSLSRARRLLVLRVLRVLRVSSQPLL
jgi:hypothetical protein